MPAELLKLTEEEKNSPNVILDTRRTRPRFFNGKFLTAADLTQEQSYLLTRQADLGRTLGFGVIDGLRVSKATVSASGISNPAASVAITRGHGLTPGGDVVFLPKNLTIDLDDVAQMQRLSAAFGLSREPQQPFQNLSGLFVLGLRAVEYTANPTPAYPPSVDGTSALRDGEVIEATAFTLVPYDSDASRKDARTARIRAAREIFLEQKIPSLPAGVLPLAMIWIRNGTLAWVDEWLVRREAGDDDRFGFGFAPRALSEAHFFHYQEMLADAPTANDGQLAASSFLEIIPSAGPLPQNVLSLKDFTQGYFPPEARVELALVPEDELSALMEDSIDLPPIDLSLKPEDQDALAILVLAPVKRSDYGNVLQTLKKVEPVLRNNTPALLGQQKPIQALLKLNAAFQLKQNMANGGSLTPAVDAPDFVDPAWRETLKKTKKLWYMRRRNIPDGKGLAGTPLPSSTHVVPGEETGPGEEETPGTPRENSETRLARSLSEEGLWGRFAFLRAISDVSAHTSLVRLLTNSVVTANPLLLQAIFTAIEKALKTVSESPEENFEQIQKSSEVKVLTPQIIERVEKRLVRTEVLRGLEVATKENPKILTDKRMRDALSRTDRIDEFAELGLKHSENEAFKKFVATVEKYASSGRTQAISDAMDTFIKRMNR